MSASDLLRRAIDALSPREVLQRLGLGEGLPDRDGVKFCATHRPDEHPGCTFAREKLHDWSRDEHLDSFDLFQRVKGLDSKQAFRPFVEMAGLGHELNGDTPQPVHRRRRRDGTFNWQECVDRVTEDHLDELAKWRGYSPEFCRWLVEQKLIGRVGENWAFSVQHQGEAVAAHVRRDKDVWFFWPTLKEIGVPLSPLTIGDAATASKIFIGESQWDVFAVLDRLGIQYGEEIAGVATRGASNGRLVKQVPGEIYLIPQNDQAGQSWLGCAQEYLGRSAKIIQVPAAYHDVNNWLQAADGAQELVKAISQTETASTPADQHERDNAISEKAKIFQIFYDSSRKAFWAPNSRDGWVTITTADVQRWLKERGCRQKPIGKETVSEIDSLLTAFQQEFDVDYAGPLAGYRRGVYQINGNRILVKDSPTMIVPKPGDWPLLKGIIRNMLGPDQELFLFGWLKVGFESLVSGTPRVGQALTLAGPKDCGKSLLQNLITEILGGRSAKPHRYMSGLTPFNSELLGSEHLTVEDEQSSADIRARRNFGTKIKEFTANVTASCHPKHRPAFTLSPFWRLSISVNDEPENLQILPPIDESLADKLIILKAARHLMPMPSVSDEDRERFMNALRAELPHFIDFLTHWQIPDHLVSQRYGITHFHHPDILEALGELAPETKLLEMIDTELFDSVAAGVWEGGASKLERQLKRDGSKVSREAQQLFSFQSACGTYLGRLARNYPKRVVSQGHTRTGTLWTINPP